MTKYQLFYNEHGCYPLCDTKEEAEQFKQKSEEKWPEMNVEIKQIEEPDDLIKATYQGNTPEVCRHIIISYLHYSQFGKLIEEHPNGYEALGCFEDWWNDYISDGETEVIEGQK